MSTKKRKEKRPATVKLFYDFLKSQSRKNPELRLEAQLAKSLEDAKLAKKRRPNPFAPLGKPKNFIFLDFFKNIFSAPFR